MRKTKKIALDIKDSALEAALIEQIEKYPEKYEISGAEQADYVLTEDQLNLPCKIGEILKQIDTHLFGSGMQKDLSFQIGDYLFKSKDRKLVGEEDIALTDKEVDILVYLHENGEQMVGREELLTEIWGYHADVTTHTLETHIYRLRQKIEEDPAEAKFLITEDGGYRLQASGS